LRKEGIIPTTESCFDPSPRDHLLGRFSQYLRLQRGLTQTTVDNYCPFVSRFLVDCFGNKPLTLLELDPSNVSNFILRHTPSQSLSRAKLMVTSLRSFFRFLFQHGEIQVDLGASVPSPAHWRRSNVPKYLTTEEVERVLSTCHQDTSVARRDYAILLLLARLGLRAGEVVGLELDDIDWRSGEIVVSGKGSVRDRLPLLHEVGEALAAYVRRDRPQSSCRRVFIRARAPHRGFIGPSAVSTIVLRAIGRAGLRPTMKGAHIFRHSLATGMLRRGASMAEVGRILRHQVPSTTEIYAKVDFDGLRSIAQPWPKIPGGVP
jgi:site-specific recombinase XerD